MPLQTVEPQRLYRQIAGQLRTLIAAGEFSPGGRLPAERDLAKQLGVSRPSVREALIALEVEGGIDVRTGSGIYVWTADAVNGGAAAKAQDHDQGEWGPLELMRARELVEGEVAALAARNARRTQIAAIASALTQMREEAGAGIVPREGDEAFHTAVAQACGNEVLRDTVQRLLGSAQRPAVRAPGRIISRTPCPGARPWSSTLRCSRPSARTMRPRRALAMQAHLKTSLFPIQRELAPREQLLTAQQDSTPGEPMQKRFAIQLIAACTLLTGAMGSFGLAQAQTKLKWAHVYETSEPFHKWSVWAGDEIKKRTNGKYEVQVFPASTLGKESDINQGLTLGTVDIILTGASFAGNSYKPLAITYFPFIFRDAEHQLKYAKSDVFSELAKGYDDKTGNHITALTYYGARHVTSQQADHQARGHEGPEDPRARCAGLPGLPEGAGRQSDADRLRRGLPGAAERHRRRAGESAAHDRGQEVLRSAEEHLADRPHRRLAAHRRLGPALGQADATRKRRSSPT